MNRICANCRFARTWPSGLIECRRHTPMRTEYLTYGLWPHVHADDWCGEHEFKEPDDVPGAAG